MDCIHLDFGKGYSPVGDGYTLVWKMGYSETKGFGWTDLNQVRAIDRGTSDSLTRAFHTGRDATFRVDLANGSYEVTALLGDPLGSFSGVSLWGNGTQLATGLSGGAGQLVESTFRVEVTNGELQLRLASDNSQFDLNALDIHPLPTSRTSAHFDFGKGYSPAADGYSLVWRMAYTDLKGFGWTDLDNVRAIDRGTSDPLTRAFHTGQDATFRVNLDNGTYEVTALL
jgi:fibronectin type 3 domain-containing protein